MVQSSLVRLGDYLSHLIRQVLSLETASVILTLSLLLAYGRLKLVRVRNDLGLLCYLRQGLVFLTE